MSDSDLLRRYADENSEESFAELVRRRIDLVYTAALRQLAGDRHRAKDVTQEVFVALARKAPALAKHPDLMGWLYTSTHFAALNVIRGEQRRRKREKDTSSMHYAHDPRSANSSDWERARPILDAAMHDLNTRDRQVILLRFFDQKSFAAIGAAIGLTENAAQKSAERALNKLQVALARRGVTSTTVALSAALAGNVVAAVPRDIVAGVTSAALAGTFSTTGSSAVGTFLFMNATKTSVTVIAVIAVVATGLVLHERKKTDVVNEVLVAREADHAALRAEIGQLKSGLAAAEQRAKAAEDDNASLLQAVTDFRAAQKVTLNQPQRKAKDTTSLSREAAIAELTATIESFEAKARAKPGYKPYQAPDESLLSVEQRKNLAQARSTAKAKNQYVFVSFGNPGGTVYTPRLGDDRVKKAYPQVTADDWDRLNERYARALAENEMADWTAKPSVK